jgi:hypothetical protein
MLLLPPSLTIATITAIATITTAVTEHSPGWDRSTSCLTPRCSSVAAVRAVAAGNTCIQPWRIGTPAARACTYSTQASGAYSPPGIISSGPSGYTRHDDRHPLLSLLVVAIMLMTDQYHHSHHHHNLQISSSSHRFMHLSVSRLCLFVTSWPTVGAGTPTRH